MILEVIDIKIIIHNTIETPVSRLLDALQRRNQSAGACSHLLKSGLIFLEENSSTGLVKLDL